MNDIYALLIAVIIYAPCKHYALKAVDKDIEEQLKKFNTCKQPRWSKILDMADSIYKLAMLVLLVRVFV